MSDIIRQDNYDYKSGRGPERIYSRIYPEIEEQIDCKGFRLKNANSKLERLSGERNSLIFKGGKYEKIIDRLTYLTGGSSSISVLSAVSGVGTSFTVVGVPVGIGLGALSFLCGFVSGISGFFLKKYKQKLVDNNKLYDIVSQGIVAFEKEISKSLGDGEIDEEEFDELCNVFLTVSNKLYVASKSKKDGMASNKEFNEEILREMKLLKQKISNGV